DRADDWIGHGWFWRPVLPSGLLDDGSTRIENAAGNAVFDFDVMEDNFMRLKQARVLTADYDLLRIDFKELQSCSDADIDEWLLRNCAFISEGQVSRLQEGGDHKELLGINSVEDFVDVELTSRSGAIRQRSGGRAATFLVNSEYSFSDGGFLNARMLDVKGVGVHKNADYFSSPKVTGLLNYADALRELAFHRLIAHLAAKDDGAWSTVQAYAILDTGLTYQGLNPATGWRGEKCVLLVRQRQSRFFPGYDGFNFSGLCPADALQASPSGRDVRRCLLRHGISAEFLPSALFHDPASALGSEEASGEEGRAVWNLQADATGRHFLDFTDLVVLPGS
ncbi:unnamed protein product, partial [Heterosigma akashiwo]